MYRCSPLPQTQTTTIVGGRLFVAEQGPIGVTLLSDGGLSQYSLELQYDIVFKVPRNLLSNPQDKWGGAVPFPSGTPPGTSTQVQLRPPTPDLTHGNPIPPSNYPKGVPIELTLTYTTPVPNSAGLNYHHSSTAGIGKDMAHDHRHSGPYSEADTASVSYGTNNTATVTFFAGTHGPHFSVALTNVCGSGLRSPVEVLGARALAFDPVSGQIQVFVGAAGSGVQLDPVTRKFGATFSGVTEPNGNGNTTAPDAQGRTFTLTATTTPGVWTLSSSTGTSITLSDVYGTDTASLIRYGTRGLAFRTVGWPEFVYLVESPALIP